MEKSAQLELFSGNKAPPEARTTARRHFWSYIRGYEKTILIIIGFMVIGIISFSLGVEKGKRTELLKVNSRLDMAVQRPALPAPKQEVQQKQKADDASAEEDYDSYTIQVASYKSRAVAQREAEFLKKKGVSTIVLSKGTYTILCVGRFSDKQKAKIFLVELKKKYRDCFIRRL